MDLHRFSMILVDLGDSGWLLAQKVRQPVASRCIELHGDPIPYKKIAPWKLPISGRIDHSMHRAWRPLGVRMLVNDDKEEDWRDLSHARA